MARPASAADYSPAAADCALFRAEMADVVPLKAGFGERVFSPPPVATWIPVRQPGRETTEAQELAHHLRTMPAPVEWQGDEQTGWFQSGVAANLRQNLRRGHWPVEAELDLHGHTQEKAWQVLNDFLALSLLQGRRYLRIIHGQGLGSKHRQPVLKPLLYQWLKQRPEILIYGAPQAEQGRSGSILVLLRRLEKLPGSLRGAHERWRS